MDTHRRTPAGQCSIVAINGTLQVNFPRELFGGKQKRLALGLRDEPVNRADAEKMRRAIQADIDFGKFDLTLEKYKPKYRQKRHLEKVAEIYPSISLVELWERFVAYKSPRIKESTLHYYRNSIEPYLRKSGIESPYAAIELRQWLIENTTEHMTKGVLGYACACFNWGLRHRLLKGSNPFQDMAKEFKRNCDENPRPNPFSPEEKALVIEAFEQHKGNWNGRGYTGYSYSRYYSFVMFLFATGCRPSEAIGLEWGDVCADFSKISFNKSVYACGSKLTISQGSKNNKKRLFPCNQELRQLLEALKPENAEPNALVFPSVKGKIIRYDNFTKKAWHTLVDPIKPDTTPYCCRDTFITEQIERGVSPVLVGRWCDTSTEMIEKFYFSEAATHLAPI